MEAADGGQPGVSSQPSRQQPRHTEKDAWMQPRESKRTRICQAQTHNAPAHSTSWAGWQCTWQHGTGPDRALYRTAISTVTLPSHALASAPPALLPQASGMRPVRLLLRPGRHRISSGQHRGVTQAMHALPPSMRCGWRQARAHSSLV